MLHSVPRDAHDIRVHRREVPLEQLSFYDALGNIQHKKLTSNLSKQHLSIAVYASAIP